eukprot:GHVU01129555.1.p1 GENE.GHVU01129555.1~~GHVU01129555.1.p1  ORF type:complete len:183 (+),score=10.21 GHVU01129555.1:502-1050(+)
MSRSSPRRHIMYMRTPGCVRRHVRYKGHCLGRCMLPYRYYDCRCILLPSLCSPGRNGDIYGRSGPADSGARSVSSHAHQSQRCTPTRLLHQRMTRSAADQRDAHLCGDTRNRDSNRRKHEEELQERKRSLNSAISVFAGRVDAQRYLSELQQASSSSSSLTSLWAAAAQVPTVGHTEVSGVE